MTGRRAYSIGKRALSEHLFFCRCPWALRIERCSLPTWRFMVAVGPVMILAVRTGYGLGLLNRYSRDRHGITAAPSAVAAIRA